MDRAQFLAAIRDQGYTGPADVAAIEKWLTDNGNDPAAVQVGEGDTAEVKSVKDIWANAPKIAVAPKPETMKSAAEAPKPKAKGYAEVGRGQDAPVSKAFAIGSATKSAYKAKIAAGRAVFSDTDEAEAFGAWARLHTVGNRDYPQKAADTEIVTKTHLSTTNTVGGALVPDAFQSTLLYLTEQYGVAPRLANNVRMASGVDKYPRKTAITSFSHIGEGQSLAASTNAYDNVPLVAKEAGLLLSASNTLLEDSAVSVSDDFARTIAEAFAIRIDDDYFLGNGTSTYGGHVGLTSALPSGAYINGAGNNWGALTLNDLIGLIGRVQNVNSSRLAFVCSRQFYFQVMLRLDTAANQFRNLTGAALSGGDASFLGYPVYFSQTLPTASASGHRACYFGDFAAASMIGTRRDLTVAGSEHAGFATNTYQWRATARFAVNVHGDGRGSTFGPIVALVTT